MQKDQNNPYSPNSEQSQRQHCPPSALFDIDTLDILLLHGEFSIPENPTFQHVEGEAVQKILDLFQRLPPGGMAKCHTPPFGLRFYWQGTLQGECTICWSCNNIYGDIYYEFEGSHAISQQLLNLLRQLSGHAFDDPSDSTDLGRGIPSRVRSLPANTNLSSTEAMEWAFIPGNTTMSGISCGLGLSVLHDFLQENQGELKIFSNDAYWRIKSGKIECSQQKINFSGTFVNLELRCD